MTAAEFTETRRRLGLNKADLGRYLGMSRSGISTIETAANRNGPRGVYARALDMVSLRLAVERRDPSLATEAVTKLCFELLDIIMSEEKAA